MSQIVISGQSYIQANISKAYRSHY